MKKSFAVFCLLCLGTALFHFAVAENVVRLEPASGAASEYNVAELLRVELNGDYIRFIAQDGTQVAEVYKYDYQKLTIAEKEHAGVGNQPSAVDDQPSVARKVIYNGQVLIESNDKTYTLTGQTIK